ncbi:hypothetical protein RAH32_15900 [Paracoccus sp. WLY502]|uniref:hypothetical protein n=1 Tax=Paracoccus yibinensis TaxID=3068891 RepID=UPI002796B7CF|nr:hypothetical protein [Paracoccus sp. WLY502]MDQ1901923.1 hypothetical protein [Paracoccus sp. WLY502]
MFHRFIDDLYAEYLLGQIGGADPERAKRALQEVCLLYARGLHFKPLYCGSLEVAAVGQLEANRFEPKVRRWCLNVLALIGTPERSLDAIQRVIELHPNDPDTMASALTAYFKVFPDAYRDLSKRSYVSPQQIALAAHIGNFGIRIRSDRTTIDIDNEAAPVLRSALVAVGLRRAPDNLFDPRFENGDLVRQLSKHDDMEVIQYAVWAINEHPELGIDHLGFDVADVERYPANIRGWTYRLYGEADIDNGVKHEVVAEGSQDFDSEVRMNLARGLRNTWYDGLETLTSPWWHNESKDEIREEILDHMVRHAGECSEYSRLAKEQFEVSSPSGPLAKRMLAAAAGTAMYAEFKRLEIKGSGDLFDFSPQNQGGPTHVTNNTINIGSIQSGAVSITGDATQHGEANNSLTGNQTVQLKAALSDLAKELGTLPYQTQELKDVTKLVVDAAVDLEPSKLTKVKQALTGLFSGTSKLAKFGGDAAQIAASVEKVIGMLPPM